MREVEFNKRGLMERRETYKNTERVEIVEPTTQYRHLRLII